MDTLKFQHYTRINSCSERTFRRKFTEYVGVSPKQYATIIRIKSFSKCYELKRSSFANIINALGYVDHSHFFREFQGIACASPSQYFGDLNKYGADIHSPNLKFYPQLASIFLVGIHPAFNTF
jgi:transcriptional regulator GlxA family with amidase domain